jgi:hypothetical protein
LNCRCWASKETIYFWAGKIGFFGSFRPGGREIDIYTSKKRNPGGLFILFCPYCFVFKEKPMRNLFRKFIFVTLFLALAVGAALPTLGVQAAPLSVGSSVVLGSPSGTLTAWDNSFNWTGVSGATWYTIEIQKDATTIFKHAESAPTICTGLTCKLTPALNFLADGNYQWRIQDTGTYGNGPWTEYQSFTLNRGSVVLGAPSGVLTSWDNTFYWTGLSYVTWYQFELRRGSTLIKRWINTADVCSGVACSLTLTPGELTLVPNLGSYDWRVQYDAMGGMGPWTAFQNFKLQFPVPCYTLTTTIAPLAGGSVVANPLPNCNGGTGYTENTVVQLTYSVASGASGFSHWSGDAGGVTNQVSVTMIGNKNVTAHFVVLGAPSGTLSTWDNKVYFTGVADATWYNLQVRNAANTVIKNADYQASAVCVGLDCSIPNVGPLANGTYTWRIKDVGLYGAATTGTDWQSFTVNILTCYTLTTQVTPVAAGSVNANPAPDCNGGTQYTSGTVVQLTSSVASGASGFSHWSGDAGGVTNPVSVTMTGNKNVTAHFVVLGAPSGTLSSWDNKVYFTGVANATWYNLQVRNASNTVIKNIDSQASALCVGLVCSIPNVGPLANGTYTWRIKDIGAYGTPTTSTDWQSFTVNILTCYTLTTQINPVATGNVNANPAPDCNGGTQYTSGTAVTLTATPVVNYEFGYWSGGASGNVSPVVVTMSGNKTVTANFRETVILTSPAGVMDGTWNGSFIWSGSTGTSWYILEVQTSAGAAYFKRSYDASKYCTAGPVITCTIPAADTTRFVNGNYKWRVQVYGPLILFGAWSGFQTFTVAR